MGMDKHLLIRSLNKQKCIKLVTWNSNCNNCDLNRILFVPNYKILLLKTNRQSAVPISD